MIGFAEGVNLFLRLSNCRLFNKNASCVLQNSPCSCIMFFENFSIAGVSRSSTIVAAYLIVVAKIGWQDAIEAIRICRSVANPNYGFQRQLEDFEFKKADEVPRFKSFFSMNIPCEPRKGPAFEKCCSLNIKVIFPICQIWFINLPFFNRPFLSVDMGYFLLKMPFENLQKRVKTTMKIPFVFLAGNNDI